MVIVKLKNDARKHASKSVKLDRNSKSEDAVFFHFVAAQVLISILEQLVSNREQTASSLIGLNNLVRLIPDYTKRAEEIKTSLKSKPTASLHLKNTSEKYVERTRYLLTQVLDYDEQK